MIEAIDLGMEIHINHKGKLGRISLFDNAREIAYLSFEVEDKRLLYATHTVVDEAYQGQGLARRLVELLVEWCECRSLLIEPVCSYVRKLSERYERLERLLERYDDSAHYIQKLESLRNVDKAKQAARFFKTGRGQYGEGDVFLGLSVPLLRSLSVNKLAPRGFRQCNMSQATLRGLWASPYHEARLLACHVVAAWAIKAENDDSRSRIYELYLECADRCNNWDLVDSSAPQVIAMYWANKDANKRSEALIELASSDSLWRQRIALVGTLGLIRLGIYRDTFSLVELLLDHKHDLIHKAMGWMLREIGKYGGKTLLTDWLDEYVLRLPRTTLRYAIEHLPETERQYYIHLK